MLVDLSFSLFIIFQSVFSSGPSTRNGNKNFEGREKLESELRELRCVSEFQYNKFLPSSVREWCSSSLHVHPSSLYLPGSIFQYSVSVHLCFTFFQMSLLPSSALTVSNSWYTVRWIKGYWNLSAFSKLKWSCWKLYYYYHIYFLQSYKKKISHSDQKSLKYIKISVLIEIEGLF